MRLKLGCNLISNKQSFIRFIKKEELYAQIQETLYERNQFRDEDDFNIVVEAIKLNELSKGFRSILTKEERIALKYLNTYYPDFDKPENYESLLSSSFEKWVEIFFKDRDCLYEELNPTILGKIMRLIRIDKAIKKTELAELLGVDRATVFQIENGKRLPSLSYIYKFSNLFGITIDELLMQIKIW